jgi:hypothetical protein
MGRFDPENNRGKRMGFLMLGLLLVLCVGVIVQQVTRQPAEVVLMNEGPQITQETILEAAAGNKKAIEDVALYFEVTVEEAEKIALQVKDQIEEYERLKEREKTLGSWEDAVKNGQLLATDPVDEDGDIAKYYDVTGDNVADFQVYFRDGEPRVWRYVDEEGQPYG